MTIDTIKGSITVRHDTLENWSREDIPGRGALRILANGEIGWIEGTSNFKIGNGRLPFKLLQLIKPDVNNSVYAVKIGNESGYYTYEDLYEIISDYGSRLSSIESTLEDEIESRRENTTVYKSGLDSFPAVGVKETFYIDTSTGNAYYYDDGSLTGYAGYHQFSGFETIKCQI